jgi:diguanylate cyclase (GGDEF)-like protein/PAS domain S-box-containing protein
MRFGAARGNKQALPPAREEPSGMKAPLPPNEAARLAALREYQVLDTAAERCFDDVTLLASQVCEAPVALVSLVDRDRQWFKAKTGLSAQETPRDLAFCAHAVAQGGLFVVPDALSDERFASNPLVTGEPRIRFYAGAPLLTGEEHALGTLCVIDRVPRELTAGQREALEALGRQVMLLLELRRSAAALARGSEALSRETAVRKRAEEALRKSEEYRDLFRLANDSILIFDPETETVLDVNDKACEVYGIPREDFVGRTLKPMSRDARRGEEQIRNLLAAGTYQAFETVQFRADGAPVHFLINSSVIEFEGRRAVLSINRDITERKRVEEKLRESEERYRTLTENAPVGIYRTTPDGRILVANPALVRLLGFDSFEELASVNLERDGVGSYHRRARFRELVERRGEVIGLEAEWTGRDGSVVTVRENARCVRGEDGSVLYYEGTVEDVTERRRAEERAYYLTRYDPLTDLPNRGLFEERLTQAVASAGRRGRALAVVSLSLDRFKVVNDTLGHAAGDALLRGVAERLAGAVRANNTVARLGGDEFCVLLPEMARAEDVAEVVRRVQGALEAPFDVAGQELFVTASAGVGLYPHDGGDAQTLLKNAGAALYRAKQLGGGACQFYAAEMNDRAFRRLSLESALRRALEREEFVVHYQPKVAIETGRVVGSEALVRWKRPGAGLVPPAEFIPLAEETGLISQLGEWVLRKALAQTARWQAAGFPELALSVNLGRVGALLAEAGFDPSRLELELTEGTVMEDTESAVGTLRELKAKGIKLSVDDFGSGYSSLSYLKHLPIDVLKIDRSFVRDMAADPRDAAIVMAVITLAHSLKLKVVAEGVETEEQLRFLRLLRCDEMQGYLFSRPLPAEVFERLLSATATSAEQRVETRTDR